MLLMIDNYDSFTYNLVQYFYEMSQEVEVHRNDAISVQEIKNKSLAKGSQLGIQHDFSEKFYMQYELSNQEVDWNKTQKVSRTALSIGIGFKW